MRRWPAIWLSLLAIHGSFFCNASLSKIRSEIEALAQRSTTRSISGQIGAAINFIDGYRGQFKSAPLLKNGKVLIKKVHI